MADAPINTAEVRAALEQGQRMFQAFRCGVEAIAIVEGLEQLARERTALAAKALAEMEAAQQELAAAKADAAAARAEAKTIRADARAKAEKTLADAAQKASHAIEQAQECVATLHAERDALVAELLEKQK